MDRTYSALLGAALLLLALAIGAQLVGLLAGRRKLARQAAGLAWASLAFGLGSFSVHLGWGHRPGTPAAMPPLEFIGEHVSFLVVLVVNLGLLAVHRRVGS